MIVRIWLSKCALGQKSAYLMGLLFASCAFKNNTCLLSCVAILDSKHYNCTKQPPAQIAGSCWHDPQLKRRLLPFDGPPARSRDLFEHRFCNIARLSSLCYHSSCIIALVSGAVSSSVSVLLTTPLCRKPPKCGNNS